MSNNVGMVFQSDQVRAWVDEEYTGHIKVIRRVNFSTLITLIRKVVEIEAKNNQCTKQVRIYIPASLRALDSENLRSLIEFSEICCDLRVSIIETDSS